MKSLICVEPGSIKLSDETLPTLQPGYALLKVKRIGICGTDLHAFEGTQPYFKYPRILGHEVSAVIEDVDPASGFEKGEAVTFIPYFNCGHCIACRRNKPNCCVNINVFGVHIDGGMRNYILVPQDKLVKSEGLSFDELALVEPLAIGAHAVNRAAIETGEFALVVGTGPIGMGIIEFARIAGAEVIAMDMNDDRLQFCRDHLHIKHTINPLKEDTVASLQQITHNDMATVVFDATGNLKAINNGINYLAHGGRYVLVGLQKEDFHFNHPEFHKRESSLMSSRNALRSDFENVITSLKSKLINPETYITHRIHFGDVNSEQFSYWLNPQHKVIKAMIHIN
ncbi:zinc-binding alcohol dehydrogenase family protein [Parafilimonas terrae]|uniref:2-desacetyl-2-hydroxyethyl bacteriochlorophyllide A dehydrogenase n=1 Tax=Parafilimonas terrae TaxID=1465490 RepID=A0A1I5U438_9BACT|nr:zinc-binding alcohol dehydrogenase family protein [Parafilimonas terrae]SFP90029.1 2-desacetyl-2-hydroxyethyl bacteriochlorophyllide A dehydrogenase [Parafilimonas terrae]